MKARWHGLQSSISESMKAWKGTRGTETSKYPEEEKENIDSVSSGESERGRAQTVMRASRGSDCRRDSVMTENGFGTAEQRELKAPYQSQADLAGSRVPQDTGNPVGRGGDHSVRLNTTQ